MLKQGQIVKYNGFKARILGFMKDGKLCIEMLEDATMLYVQRSDIEC